MYVFYVHLMPENFVEFLCFRKLLKQWFLDKCYYFTPQTQTTGYIGFSGFHYRELDRSGLHQQKYMSTENAKTNRGASVALDQHLVIVNPKLKYTKYCVVRQAILQKFNAAHRSILSEDWCWKKVSSYATPLSPSCRSD